MTSGSELATTNRLELNKAGSLLPNTIPGSMSDSVLSYFPPGQGRYLDAIWVTLAGERLAKKKTKCGGHLGQVASKSSKHGRGKQLCGRGGGGMGNQAISEALRQACFRLTGSSSPAQH